MTQIKKILEEKKFGVPEGWREVCLSDVVEINSSKRIFANEYKTLGIPFFRGKEVTEKFNGNKVSTELFITEEKYLEIKNKYGVPKEKDILLTSVGTLGNPYLVEKDFKFYFKDGNLTWFHDYKDLNPEFLFYWIISSVGKEGLSHATIGSTQQAYTMTALKKVGINLPPLPTQKSIAKILSSFDEKIELLREQNETLEKIGQEVFKEWFGGYKVGEELPEGWRVGKIKELINIFSGFAFKSENFIEGGKYGLVTIKNVQNGSFVKETKDRLNSAPEKMPEYCNLKTGDILLSLTGNVGRICHVVGENYFLNQRVAKLESKNKKDFSFTYLFFRQKNILDVLENLSSGTAQQNLSPIKTSELEIIIPDRKILNKFGYLVNPKINKILSNLEQIETLGKTRDELLPRLMKGEVLVD